MSRGGEKLAGALDSFGIDPAGRTCLDVGASTGGFTDCLLQRGATRVYALDVGRGQLAESLRTDPRVVSMERTHAARLDPGIAERLVLPEPVTLTVADVSFISLTRLLPGHGGATAPGGDILPHGQAPVRARHRGMCPAAWCATPALRAAAVARVREHGVAAGPRGPGRVESPLVGPAGNHEWFLWLQVPAQPAGASGVKRIGFAYNPTNEQALELRERAIGWCTDAGHRLLGLAGRLTRRVSAELPGTERWSSWVATARSCGRPGRRRSSTCPSWASTAARSASCPRPSRMPWRPCSASSLEGASSIEPRMMLEVRSLPAPVATPTTRGTTSPSTTRPWSAGRWPAWSALEVNVDASHVAT